MLWTFSYSPVSDHKNPQISRTFFQKSSLEIVGAAYLREHLKKVSDVRVRSDVWLLSFGN